MLTREKTTGAHPGFTARDAKGDTWFLEFDPPYFAEGATGAVEVATKIFWGLGYNQVESFLTTFDPKKASIDPEASLRRPSGKRTPFRQDDVNAILERVHRNKDGTYRVIAGRLIGGKSSAISPSTAHARTTPTTSCRTNGAVSSAHCACSVPGRT